MIAEHQLYGFSGLIANDVFVVAFVQYFLGLLRDEDLLLGFTEQIFVSVGDDVDYVGWPHHLCEAHVHRLITVIEVDGRLPPFDLVRMVGVVLKFDLKIRLRVFGRTI
jgi:hypothetical protein